MLKCLFVDLTSIKSKIPKSQFDRATIEKLADLILASDGLLSPLILIADGVERYKIVEGDLAYYAALRAKEKDLRKAEMVNAFVIPAEHQQVAIEQLALFAPTKVVTPPPQEILIPDVATPPVAVDIDKLLDRLSVHFTAEMTRQLAPISQQLATITTTVDRHDRILTAAVATPATPPPDPDPLSPPPIEEVPKPKKTATTPTARKTAKQQPAKSSAGSPQKLAPTVIPSELLAPVTTTKKSTTTKNTPTNAVPKKTTKSDAFAGIDPEKLARTLQLVNTSQPNELALMMSRSGIKNGEKLAIDLTAKRDTQPQQLFKSWAEIVSAKITKLTTKNAIEIVNKLK
jgi:hypothetical protein